MEINRVKIIEILQILLYKENPSLLEKINFEDDNIFLEPLLFAYFNSKKDNLFSEIMLTEITQGYFVEKESLLLKESFNNEGIAYVPNLGYFDKNGSKIDDILKIDAFEILKTSHPLLEKYFVEFYKGHIVNANPNHNSVWEENYKEILNGFKLTKKIYGNNNANCLCVVDINHNPLEVYQHFKEIEANDVHLLFPDNTHDTNTINKGQLFDWLKVIFDLWYEDKDVQKPKIRPFIDFIGLLLGELNYGNEMYGKRQNKTLVIETNGNIETVDTLKICGNGFTNTNLNIFENELDDIYVENELARKYYNSHFELCKKCTMCPLEEICGGGFLGHRYSKAKGFDNTSIYCNDLAKLICYIQNKVYDNLPKDLQDKIEKLHYEDIKEFIES